MKTILITGIHGFVGSNLVNCLKSKYQIYGLDIVSPEKEGIIRTFSWDELESLPEVDTVIHLAGKAHDTKNKSEAQSYFEINTELTKKIFDYFLQSKAGQFIFFSSVKAAADAVEGEILTEDVIPKPVGPYGESKIAAENYILNHSLPENKKVYILRPCMIHGSGNKGNLNLLYKVVNKKIPWPLGAYNNHRTFCSIENLFYVINELISKNIESGIYNICDDEFVSTNDLIKLMSQTMNKKSTILNVPEYLINFLAKTGDILHLPLTTERLNKLTENYVVSNQKIKRALSIEKMPITADEGLRKTFESFKQIK